MISELERLKETLKGMIIYTPTDSYQYGYNSAILDMLDRIDELDAVRVGYMALEKTNELQA